MQDKKKIITQGIIFGVTFFAAFFIAKALFSGNSHRKEMVKLSEEMNKKCPMMADQETRLDKTVANADTLEYHYTLVNVSDENRPDIGEAKKFLMAQTQNNLDNSPEMKEFRSNDVYLKYSYQDKNGKPLLDFIINTTK